MTHILMTGITGLVGSSFVTELLRKRNDVHISTIVRRHHRMNSEKRVWDTIEEQCDFDGEPAFVSPAWKHIELIEGDICDPATFEKVQQKGSFDSIFHCAADVNLGKDPEGKTFCINYEGTKNILEFAKNNSIQSLHYVSTAYVAGKSEGLVKEDSLNAEDFNNSYEKSKFQSETLIRKSGIPFTIYRPSIIVGRLSDGKIRKPLAFYRLLEFLGKFKKHLCSKMNISPTDWLEVPLRLQAKPSDRIYFVPIDYVQKSITELFLKPNSNKTYHITGKSPISTNMIEDVVEKVLKVKGVRIKEEIKNPTMDEKLMHRFIQDLLPYFSTRTEFDVSNVEEALGKESLDWTLNYESLGMLIGGYFKYFFPKVEWLQHLN